MIVHLLSGHTVSIVISEDEQVSIVKKRIQQVIGRPHENISLVSNGIILDNDSKMSDYRFYYLYASLLDLTNNSTITAVNPPHPTSISVEEQEKQVEEYLISMCARLKPANGNEGGSPVPSEDESLKVLSEIADKTSKCRSMEMEDIWKGFLEKDELMTTWAGSEFFGTIIRRTDIIREVLLSHPLIAKLIVVNPGLQEFLENDDNIRELVEIMKTPNKEEKIHKREKILHLIEEKLGRKLVFTPEHVRIT